MSWRPSVTNLRPKDTAEDPFLYTFKVQCTSCRETHPNPVTVGRFVGSLQLRSATVSRRRADLDRKPTR